MLSFFAVVLLRIDLYIDFIGILCASLVQSLRSERIAFWSDTPSFQHSLPVFEAGTNSVLFQDIWRHGVEQSLHVHSRSPSKYNNTL